MYHCDFCDKWFCERHLEPRLPHFIDWDSIHDIPGIPEFKALYYMEYKHEGGHPDFVYSQKRFEAFAIEEKVRNALIKQAIDRMVKHYHEKYVVGKPVDAEADRKKRVEILGREEKYKITARARAFSAFEPDSEKTIRTRTTAKKGSHTRTYGNIHHYEFEVPSEVYADAEFRHKLDDAKTMSEVEQIINDYNKHHQKNTKPEQPKKKKNWWQ